MVKPMKKSENETKRPNFIGVLKNNKISLRSLPKEPDPPPIYVRHKSKENPDR
jgi:hypothetical protein